jgi:hypothetical protein
MSNTAMSWRLEKKWKKENLSTLSPVTARNAIAKTVLIAELNSCVYGGGRAHQVLPPEKINNFRNKLIRARTGNNLNHYFNMLTFCITPEILNSVPIFSS